jgi:hypothetical protein
VQLRQHVHAEQRRCQIGQDRDAQPLGPHTAVEFDVGPRQRAVHRATRGRRGDAALAAQPGALGERERQRGPSGAGIDEELDIDAVDATRPVVVAVGAAPDLDHAVGRRRESRARLLRLPELDGKKQRHSEQAPDGDDLERGRKIVHRRSLASVHITCRRLIH